MTKEIAVIGAGSWGTALSIVLADNLHNVTLWTRTEAHADDINRLKLNEKYIDAILPDNIYATANLNEALEGKKYIVLVTPSHSLEELLPLINKYIDKDSILIHAIKGILPDSLLRISEVIFNNMPNLARENLAVLSGPSHAEEVALRKPTTVVISSENSVTAKKMQDLFNNKNFRVYTNSDVIGTELGGALKNIIALGAGISDGLGFGDNAKAALMTRGLAEITRLGINLGADAATFSGLAGIGDLIVTCTSLHSRNYKAGKMIGEGKSLNDVLNQMNMVVEGIRTTKAAYELSIKHKINMPITYQLNQVLFNNKNAKIAVEELMGRVQKEEFEENNN